VGEEVRRSHHPSTLSQSPRHSLNQSINQSTGTTPVSSSNIVNLAPFHSEAWRYTGRFSRFNRFKSAFPGLGIATVAFAGYCLYEHFFMTEKHHH
jgi:hypothetical protein